MRMCIRPETLGFSACGRGSEEGGGWTGAERASPTDTNQSGGSWVMFVNTHWGLILCTLYMLRTLYVCLSWVLLLGCLPPPSLPSSSSSTLSLSQGLWWKCCSCLSQCVCLFLITCTLYSPRTFTLLSPGIHILRSLKLTAVCPPPLPPPSFPPLPPFDIVSSLQTLISCDTMHHGPSLCMDCVPPAQTSGRRASVTLCLMLYSKWGCRTSQALSQSKNPNI